MIFVDQLFALEARDPTAFRVGQRRGHRWCHMWCNPGDEAELHILAKSIGMRTPRCLGPEEAIVALGRVSLEGDLRRAVESGIGAFEKDETLVIPANRTDILSRFVSDEMFQLQSIDVRDSSGECAIEGGVIVIKPQWFQWRKSSFSHYDLVPERRIAALRHGARERSLRDWLMEKRTKVAV